MKPFVTLLVFSAVLFSGLALAQGVGTIGGTVTDPSGAVVPSVTVTVTEVGTGYSRSATTSGEGYYVIPSLRPGRHTLTAEAPGFRNYSQIGIFLLADQSLTVNVGLELGRAAETITVEASPLQVDTTTGTLNKQVVDQTRMVELPLNGRNAAELTLLVAGTIRAPAGDADQGISKTFPGAVTISSNGSRQNQVGYLLDGGNFTDQYTNVNMPFPSPDALQEFSVQTSNYGAEHGQSAGGVVNVVIKSGTNDLHGDLFGFLRNAVFNARNFFAANRDQLKRSQFGGTVGGPVVIPGAYRGQDRTFFFFGYQGTRIRNLQGGLSAFVPTADNINGDFSALLAANDPNNPLGRVIQVRDPATGQPFPGNQISPDRFDPASRGLLRYLPSSSGSGLVNYNRPISQDFYEILTRVDHSLSNADRLSFRWSHNLFDNAATFEPENILTYRNQSKIPFPKLLASRSACFSFQPVE